MAQLTSSNNSLTLLLGMAIGGATGVGVLSFRWLIDRIHDLAFESLDDWLGGSRWLWTLLIPIVGGLVVGGLRWYWRRLWAECFFYVGCHKGWAADAACPRNCQNPGSSGFFRHWCILGARRP